MGLFGSLFNALGDISMSQYGIDKPRDALQVIQNMARRGKIYDQDESNPAKHIVTWLKRLSNSTDRRSREAAAVLESLRNDYSCRNYLEKNSIKI